jgi:hypothetical protein
MALLLLNMWTCILLMFTVIPNGSSFSMNVRRSSLNIKNRNLMANGASCSSTVEKAHIPNKSQLVHSFAQGWAAGILLAKSPMAIKYCPPLSNIPAHEVRNTIALCVGSGVTACSYYRNTLSEVN